MEADTGSLRRRNTKMIALILIVLTVIAMISTYGWWCILILLGAIVYWLAKA